MSKSFQICSQNLNNKEEFYYDCKMLHISHLHSPQGLKAISAPFLTETEGAGLNESLIPCTLGVNRKGYCFVLRTTDNSSIWHVGTHIWFAVSRSQAAASESASFPTCSQAQADSHHQLCCCWGCHMSCARVFRAIHSHTGKLMQHWPAHWAGFYSEEREIEQGVIEIVFRNFQCS